MTNVLYPRLMSTVCETGYEPSIVIADDKVTIGELELSGKWIDRDGVIVRPGFAEVGEGDLRITGSQVTITFNVGNIEVEPEAIGRVRVEQRLGMLIDTVLTEPDGEVGDAPTA